MCRADGLTGVLNSVSCSAVREQLLSRGGAWCFCRAFIFSLVSMVGVLEVFGWQDLCVCAKAIHWYVIFFGGFLLIIELLFTLCWLKDPGAEMHFEL